MNGEIPEPFSSRDYLDNLGLLPGGRPAIRELCQLPQIAPSAIADAALRRYNTLSTQSPFYAEKLASTLPSWVIGDRDAHLVLLENPSRTQKYLTNARRHLEDNTRPVPGDLRFHTLNTDEMIGYLAGTGTLIMINISPWSFDSVIFVTPPAMLTPYERQIFSNDLHTNHTLIVERLQEPTYYTEQDYRNMARVAQEGKMLVWTVMSAPSQRQQHYQAIRDVQHHTVLPITKSVILGNFDRHRIMMGTLNDRSPITLRCITTTDPREAHYIECALAKQGLNMDCLVSRGKNEPVFVIFPSYSDANPVVKFFAGSGNNWAWIPTAERAGFILRPPFLFPDTDTNTLRLGAHTIHSTVLIQEFFGRINTSPTVHDAYTLYD